MQELKYKFSQEENLDSLFKKGYEAVVFFDTETTGFSPEKNRVIEIAALRVERNGNIREYDEFIRLPEGCHIPDNIVKLTHITDDMLAYRGIEETEAVRGFSEMIHGNVLMAAHNLQFDLRFMNAAIGRHKNIDGVEDICTKDTIDSLTILRDRKDKPHKLASAIEWYGLDGAVQNSHRAIDDTIALYAVMRKMAGQRNDLVSYINLNGYTYGEPGDTYPRYKYVKQTDGYKDENHILSACAEQKKQEAKEEVEEEKIRMARPKETWRLLNKRADFRYLAMCLGEEVDPIAVKVMRNRGLTEEPDMRKFLWGGRTELYNPHLLKDGDNLADILMTKIRMKKHIRVIGDYDVDGVMSTYILVKALTKCGANVSHQIPERIKDGYGLNMNLIEKAHEDKVDTILTCDNGIAALKEIERAKELGMTVLVTDHHAVPYEVVDGITVEKKSAADAVVNPHQEYCPYPNKDLCGAAVAWKVVQILYEMMHLPKADAFEFIENVAFATVCDVMDLTDENRILVKEGLKAIHETHSIGMIALLNACGLEMADVNAYHFGFVLGPCINACGRLETAEKALSLMLEDIPIFAQAAASDLVALNEERKRLTDESVKKAMEIYTEKYTQDTVVTIYLPDTHESIAGIIAGRVREATGKPAFVFTDSGDVLKGSGRSIEAYSMYDELCKAESLLLKFGGHPMAAGLSLKKENFEEFHDLLNKNSGLKPDDLAVKVYIDCEMPMGYVSDRTVQSLEMLEPFGKGNPKPLFAERGLKVCRMQYLGEKKKALKLRVSARDGFITDMLLFTDVEGFVSYLTDKWGEQEVTAAFQNHDSRITMDAVYTTKYNYYCGMAEIQFIIEHYR